MPYKKQGGKTYKKDPSVVRSVAEISNLLRGGSSLEEVMLELSAEGCVGVCVGGCIFPGRVQGAPAERARESLPSGKGSVTSSACAGPVVAEGESQVCLIRADPRAPLKNCGCVWEMTLFLLGCGQL